MGDPRPPGDGFAPIIERISSAERRLDSLEVPGGTQRAQTTRAVQQQLDYLTSLQRVEYAEFTAAITGTANWVSSPAAVNISTPTGRLAVTYGGAANGGFAYFAYSIVNASTGAVIVNRDTIRNNPARRVAISGGASFAPSGSQSAVVTVPANTNLTVRVEAWCQDSFVAIFGGSIQAQVVP